jgi:hypothetical protein
VVGKAQESPAECYLFPGVAIGEESVVPNAREVPPSAGQDVEEESPKELHCIEGHRALLVAISVVLPREADFAFLEGNEALVGDSDPVGIAGEVLEDLSRTSEGWFGVDNPAPLPKGPQPPFVSARSTHSSSPSKGTADTPEPPLDQEGPETF